MATATVGVKLDEKTRTRLKKLGQAKQRSTHWLMKDAIVRYLESEERYVEERVEDDSRWQRYLDTGTHLSDDGMTQWLEELAERAARKAGSQ